MDPSNSSSNVTSVPRRARPRNAQSVAWNHENGVSEVHIKCSCNREFHRVARPLDVYSDSCPCGVTFTVTFKASGEIDYVSSFDPPPPRG